MSDRRRGELLDRLKRIQDEHHHLPRERLTEVSEALEVRVGAVFGVATFYSFLSPRPQGRNVIRACGSLPCHLKDAELIIRSVKDEIGIGPGETTDDGRFSFELTSCIGACDAAPAVLVNDDVHGDLTPTRISQILRSYE